MARYVSEVSALPWAMLLLLGVGANLDNVCVGLAYGMKGARIGWKANAVIAGVALLASGVGSVIGGLAGSFLSIQAAHYLGAAILILLGLYPTREMDRTGTLNGKQTLLLSMALCFSNLSVGVGGALSHLPALPVALVGAVGSWVMMALGEWIGRVLGLQWLGKGASYTGTALLVAVAIWMLR